MSYFDSPKNNALWEKKMTGLREERRRRQETGFVPETEAKAMHHQEQNPFRRQITLEQLEQIEMEAMGIRRVRRPERAMQAGTVMEAGTAMETGAFMGAESAVKAGGSMEAGGPVKKGRQL